MSTRTAPLTIHVPDDATRVVIKDGLNRITRQLDYASLHGFLRDPAEGKLRIRTAAPAQGAGMWVRIERIADDAFCSACNAPLREGGAFAELLDNGTLSPVDCEICAVH